MNRGQLKTAVLDMLVRQDLTENPIVDSWITTATSRLNQELLINDMLTHVTLTVTKNNIELPPDFISAKTVRLTKGDFGATVGVLTYAPPEEIADMTTQCGWPNNYPGFYTTYGDQMELVPYQAGSTFNIDLWYYGEILDPPTIIDTNVILTKYPQLYLNLVASIGHQYLLEMEDATNREAMAMAEIQRIMARKDAEKYGDGPLIVRPTRRIGGRFS